MVITSINHVLPAIFDIFSLCVDQHFKIVHYLNKSISAWVCLDRSLCLVSDGQVNNILFLLSFTSFPSHLHSMMTEIS